MEISTYYENKDKKLKVDVTDIISFKNDLKFELKIKENNQQKILNEYDLIEILENDEYLFYLVFDFENICFEEVKSARLIQFKNNKNSNNKIIYYSLKII